jgi:hypothetical protein
VRRAVRAYRPALVQPPVQLQQLQDPHAGADQDPARAGRQHFRYDPERSDTQPRSNTPRPVAAPPAAAPEDPATSASLASKRERIARLAERKRKVVEVEKAFVKAAGVMRNISKNLFARPKECLEEVANWSIRWSRPFSTSPKWRCT